MDRQEQILNLAKISRVSVAYAEDLYDSFFGKPVVPQYVADWYEGNKVGFEFNLIDWIKSIPLGIEGKGVTEFDEWLLDDDNKPIQTLVDMHRLGYTVEKEPRYTVGIRGISEINRYLNQEDGKNFVFADSGETEDYRTKFTRKELESNGFGWVLDCPGVEVKEVDDGND